MTGMSGIGWDLLGTLAVGAGVAAPTKGKS